jgi:general secretion pathway protein F
MAHSPRISLEDLIALNDEMAALVRAGIPLDQGLRSMGREIPGRLGKFTTQLSERLEKGQSLEQAVGDFEESLPSIYRAVVTAGLRSGRLAAALEGLTRTVRRVAELRRTVIAAMVYPIIVLLVASGLFWLTAWFTVPAVASTYTALGVERPAWYQAFLRVTEVVPGILPWVWLVLIVLIVVWLYRSRRATRTSRGSFGRLPSFGRILHAGRMATFAEVLALMVEQEVPMDEAVVLASAASGDAALARSGKKLAEQIRRGEGTPDLEGIPPLLEWLLVRGVSREHLLRSLRRTGSAYRRRASYWGNWLSIYLPIFLSAAIGGSITLFYVLLVLAPFYNLIYALS